MINYRKKIKEIKGLYLLDLISLEEAEILLKPILEEMNIKGANIAKKFDKKYKNLTFSYVFR